MSIIGNRRGEMYKHLFTALGVVALLSVAVLLYLRMDRFALVPQGGQDGHVYKIDKRTGRVWLIVQNHSFEIADPQDRKIVETPEEKAISLAKLYYPSPSTSSTMAETIRSWLQAKKGSLRVHGWKAKKIDDQTYLVGYTFDEGPGTNPSGWAFEVNLEAEIVRPMLGDQELEKKYADWASQVTKTK